METFLNREVDDPRGVALPVFQLFGVIYNHYFKDDYF